MKIICYILTDIVLLAYAFAGAVALRIYTGAPPEMLRSMGFALGPFLAAYLIALAGFGAYNFSKIRSESDLGFSALYGVATGTFVSFVLATIAIVYYFPEAQPIGRSVYLMALGAGLLLLPLWRVWYTRVRRKRGDLRSHVLAVGEPARIAEVAKEIQVYSRSGHEIRGCVMLHETADPLPENFLGHLGELPALVERHQIDEILILGDVLADEPDKLIEILALCDQARVRVHVLPGLYEALVGRLDIYEIGGIPLLELRANPLGRFYGPMKRAIDIASAILGLIAASPIIVATAIIVKLDSKGPVFYKQIRSGLHGRGFEIIKFRTMRTDAEKNTGPVWAMKEDPRITRVGRFLRNKRIDEIPQLWNVLRGDMSLVGPRPERPHFIEEFSKDDPLFPLRLRVRPGVTALSHVWGRYDSTPTDRLRYDLVYLSNVSFRLDLRIMFDTVKTVITGRGAQ
ncbi:MAG: sugar transferase [Candidatus Hydrogenedentes bacterium]|nr:sugar transferase [Candidatus Hydrogenedentota bacterium]